MKTRRRSIFTTRPIRAGERFTPDNTAILRNGNLPSGLPPEEYDGLLGKIASRPLHAFEPLLRACIGRT